MKNPNKVTDERTLEQLHLDLHWAEYHIELLERRIDYLLDAFGDSLNDSPAKKNYPTLMRMVAFAKARIAREQNIKFESED